MNFQLQIQRQMVLGMGQDLIARRHSKQKSNYFDLNNFI